MSRWILVALLLTSCGLFEPTSLEDSPSVEELDGRLQGARERLLELREEREKLKRLGSESRTRPNTRCFRIELDDSERWIPGDGFDSEREYLEESCYQEGRFLREHLWCMFGTTDTFKYPSRLLSSYPCLFSVKYELKYGITKRDKERRLGMAYTIENAEGIEDSDSGKALLVEAPELDVPVWVPHSQIHDDSEVYRPGTSGDLADPLSSMGSLLCIFSTNDSQFRRETDRHSHRRLFRRIEDAMKEYRDRLDALVEGISKTATRVQDLLEAEEYSQLRKWTIRE